MASTTAGNYFGGIVKSGMVLMLDAAKKDSYPRAGTTWYDISGNNFNGTMVNGPVYSSDNGGNIFFDGTDDYINLGDRSEFTYPNGFTFDMFFKPTTITTGNPILEKYGNTGSASAFEYVCGFLNNRFYGWVADANNSGGWRGRYVDNVSSFVTVNQWCHLAFVYDGGVNNSSIKLYINGVQRDNTDFGNLTFVSIRDTTTPLTLSLQNWGLGGPIKGSLGNIRLYNKALTASEVLQNYNALRGRYL